MSQPTEEQQMTDLTVTLKCKDDGPSWDQVARVVAPEGEDEAAWHGRPIANPACPVLSWPKYAWKAED